MTIGNVVRHKAICRSNISEEESTSDEEEPSKPRSVKRRTPAKRYEKNKESDSNSSEEDDDEDNDIPKSLNKKTGTKSHKENTVCDSNSSEEAEEQVVTEEVSSRNRQEKKQSTKSTVYTKTTILPRRKPNVYDFSDEDEDSNQRSYDPAQGTSKTTATHGPINECLSEDDCTASPTLKKRLRKTSEGKYEIIDEMNNNKTNKFKKPTVYKVPDIEDEIMKSDESNTDCETENTVIDTGSWWQNIHEELYTDHGYNGMKIFYKTDTKDFVEKVIQNWKTHEARKCELDRKREEIENSDVALNQFSPIRDQPILTAYTEFVQSHSTKDVLQIFSADYDEHSVQMGVKASTAKNYANRILEFFKYMADVYESFHLDWFADYGGKIEKKLPNGQKSKEIFIPTKEDLTNFVKQFKYGTNPAASVGLRIFALKKLMDFLTKLYEDNEQSFPGTIMEKSEFVNCLVEKLSKLNRGIGPDGTIKKISIASNRNHKQALIEQTLLCPEKSIKNIMEGVSSYLNSNEYSDMKTLLLELSCKKTKVATKQEYMLVTNWLLEMLICLGGNRPCSLLGITIGNVESFYSML